MVLRPAPDDCRIRAPVASLTSASGGPIGPSPRPAYQSLYRRWLTDGDTVFELVSSTAIADALARGTARIESHVLLRSYRHLSPLVSLVRSSSQGVEEGDTPSARPQPPPPVALTVAEELARDWYRLIGRS